MAKSSGFQTLLIMYLQESKIKNYSFIHSVDIENFLLEI